MSEELIEYSENLYKSINKKFGEGVLTDGLSIVNEPRTIIPISPSLDVITSGGIIDGSWVGITGPEKTGKTVLALNIAAKAQRPEYGNRDVYYFNIEGRITKMHVLGIKGLILDKPRFNLIRSVKGKILTAQEQLEICSDVIKNHPGCVIIMDSFSALCDEKEMTEGLGKEIRGGTSKLVSQFLRLNNNIVPVNKTIFIGLTQQIANVTGYGASVIEKTPNAWKYQKDYNLRAKTKKSWDVGEKQIGLETTWECLCSALGPPGRTCQSFIRFGTGIDEVFELQELAISLGLIKKSSSWFSVDGQKFQGSEKLYQYLNDNQQALTSLRNKLNMMAGLLEGQVKEEEL